MNRVICYFSVFHDIPESLAIVCIRSLDRVLFEYLFQQTGFVAKKA